MKTKKINLTESWDLEDIFKGGSDSIDLVTFMNKTDEKLTKLLSLDLSTETLVLAVEDIAARVEEAHSFIYVLNAQNVHDVKAQHLRETINEQLIKLQQLKLNLENNIKFLSEEAFQAILNSKSLSSSSFMLENIRKQGQEKLENGKESLIINLAKDGYHAWGVFYNNTVGNLKIPFEENNNLIYLSIGQLNNRLNSIDREIRKRSKERLHEVWKEKAPLIAQILNHLAGFRLKVYEERAWDNALKESCIINRVEEKTIQTMWEVVSQAKGDFQPYFQKKAEWLQISKLSLIDVTAPLPSKSLKNRLYTYKEACALILKSFQEFSPKLASFTEMAITKKWIEIEDRSNKRPGAFCADFPLKGEPRIFMTYDGTISSVITLAHELGHAFHIWCLRKKSSQSQKEYPMSIAETASTLTEMLVADTLIEETDDIELKKILLENKVSRATSFLMDIHSRFLFETRFYELRKKGTVTNEELQALMLEAQDEAYDKQVSDLNPYSWSSKLHFYITEIPFYNYPYTFGYLFSMGIYARSLRNNVKNFDKRYIELLEDSGSMTAEALAFKHLQVKLTERDFWEQAINIILADVNKLCELK